MTASLTLGGYSFDPVPTVSIEKTWVRTESGCPINAIKTATFTGTLYADNKTAPASPLALRQTMEEAFEACNNCVQMVLMCDTDVVIDAYVRIQSIAWGESPDNWTLTIPITVTVEWDEAQDNTALPSGQTACLSCIRQITDTWNFTTLETPSAYTILDASGVVCGTGPSFFQFDHTVEAQAVDCCISGAMTSGYVIAQQWVNSQLGFDASLFAGDPKFGFDNGDFAVCGHTRAGSLSPKGGSYSVQESFTVSSPAVDCCVDDWTVNCEENSESNLKTYSIEGRITGFETRDPNDFNIITETKVQQAKACYNSIVDILPDRIACCCPAEGNECPINPIPLTTAVGYSPTAGTVSYSRTFDNRPNSLIEGAIFENITINDVNAQEQIIEIPIPGRIPGPILRSCFTQPTKRKTINIDVIFPRDDCPVASGLPCDTARLAAFELSTVDRARVDALLCCVEATLSDADFLARESDTENITIPNGRYTRNVTWVYQRCTDSLPSGCP